MLIQIDYVWVEFKLIVHVVQNIQIFLQEMINPAHEHLLRFVFFAEKSKSHWNGIVITHRRIVCVALRC